MRGTTGTTPSLPGPLARAIEAEQQRFSGRLALWVHDLRRRETFGLGAEEPFDAASTIKVFVLLELFRQAYVGAVTLDEEVELRERDMVDGSGVLKDLTPGLRLSLRDAAVLMVTASDNVAANLVIRRVGVGAVNRGARAAGATCTRLSGPIMLHRRQGPSCTTARDLGVVMTRLARRGAVCPAASREMLDILGRERADNIVGRLLPDIGCDGRPLRRSWRVASKNGLGPGIRNDVALVQGNGLAYVIALLSRGCRDLRVSPDNEATLCLARIARAVHDHVAASASVAGIDGVRTSGPDVSAGSEDSG